MPISGKSEEFLDTEKNVGQHSCPTYGFIGSALSASIDSFLQLGAGNELRHFLGRNLQRSTGLGIAAGSRFTRTYRKRSKTNQRHLVSLLQRRHNTVERGIQSIARLDFGNLRVSRDLVN